MNKRGRGFGGIYRRGGVLWIRYSFRGQKFRESSGSTDEAKALQLLKRRIKEMGRARFVGPAEERLRFEDLMRMLVTDYEINRRRSLDKLSCRIAHLSEAFSQVRAIDITSDRIAAYVLARQQPGDDGRCATNATINRELAALKRALSLAIRAGRLGSGPHIAMLKEDAPRQGFISHGEFSALRDSFPTTSKILPPSYICSGGESAR